MQIDFFMLFQCSNLWYLESFMWQFCFIFNLIIQYINQNCWLFFASGITLWPFGVKGYCYCLHLSISPSIRTSICLSFHKLYSSAWYLLKGLSWNHQICTKHASCDTPSCYWKWVSSTFFKFILAILTQYYGNVACVWHLSQICAKIAQFTTNMHFWHYLG